MTRKNFLDLWDHKDGGKTIRKIFSPYIEEYIENNADEEDVESTKQSEKEALSNVKDFIYLELLFYSQELIFDRNKFLKKDPVSIFANHEEKIYDSIKFTTYQERTLKITTFFLKDYYKNREYEFLLNRYFAIPEEWRLYSLATEKDEKRKKETLIYKNPYLKFCLEREDIYRQILNNRSFVSNKDTRENKTDLIRERHKNKQIKVFTKENEVKFVDVKKVVETDAYASDESTFEFKLTKLIEQRRDEKEKIPLKGITLTRDIFVEMDKENDGKLKMAERFDDLIIKKLEKEGKIGDEAVFSLDEVNYILGPLGSGKSTLSLGLIFLMGKLGKKVLIPSMDVQSAFDLKQELSELGIKKTTVLLPKTINDRKKHRENFILGNASKYKDSIEFLKERKGDLELLDTSCVTAIKLQGKFKSCADFLYIKGENGNFVCPMHSKCGYCAVYRSMLDSDVWIGAYETILNSNVPYVWDRYERSFYELGVLWADIVIIDEADVAQTRMDKAFIDNKGIVIGDNERNAENYFVDYLLKTEPLVDKSKGNHFRMINTYSSLIDQIGSISRYMYSNIFCHRMVTDFLSDKAFSPYQLLYEWLERYTDLITVSSMPLNKTPTFQKIFESMSYKIPEFESVDEKFRDELEKIHRLTSDVNDIEQKKYDHINESLERIEKKHAFNLKVFDESKNKSKLLLRNRLFEFLLFFFKFNDILIYLRNQYGEFIEQANVKNSHEFSKDFLFPRSTHSLYAPEALTDKIYAYRLNRNGKHSLSLIDFQQIFYFGVGRNLMYKMHKSFQHIEEHKSPILVFLSATSYAPKSSHFHLDIEPNWLITNKNQLNQKINCFFTPFKDNGKPLSISGESDYATRMKNIDKIAKKMVKRGYLKQLLSELDERHKEEEKFLLHSLKDPNFNKEIFVKFKKEKRPCIAIVTSSFETAEAFTRSLFEAGIPKEKVRTLFREGKKINGDAIAYDKDYHITKSEVYDLYRYDIDFFVFVWKSLDRGYNILRGPSGVSKKSYIGKMIFLNRPHPKPNDFSDAIMFLHGAQGSFDEKVKLHHHSKALGVLHQQANAKLNEIFAKKISWSALSNKDRLIYGFNELIPIDQTIGRGVRGGTDLDVYYVDAKFGEKTALTSEEVFIDDMETSILATWSKLLNDESDELMKVLYGTLAEGLKHIQVKHF